MVLERSEERKKVRITIPVVVLFMVSLFCILALARCKEFISAMLLNIYRIIFKTAGLAVSPPTESELAEAEEEIVERTEDAEEELTEAEEDTQQQKMAAEVKDQRWIYLGGQRSPNKAHRR